MGGGGQANSGQASQAAQQQTAANAQDMALSKQYGGQEQEIFNKLFGTGGKGGTLTPMMDPASLTQKDFNPAYKAQWNQAQNQIAKNYSDQRGQLSQAFANSGAGSNSTPSGFQADQMNKLSRGEADTRGGTFADLAGRQYSDALNNFWNANNIASGQAAGNRSAAVEGAGNSGSSSASIYGTAGAYHPGTMGNVLGSAIGAGGTVGAAAMCPASGAKILMGDGSKKNVEDLRKGDFVRGCDGQVDELLDDPCPSKPQDAVWVRTREFQTRVSYTHALVRASGGYALAGKAIGQTVSTLSGNQGVLELVPVNEQVVCWHLFLNRSHSYNVDGIWSLE